MEVFLDVVTANRSALHSAGTGVHGLNLLRTVCDFRLKRNVQWAESQDSAQYKQVHREEVANGT
jgi:hypothetical protein